MCMVEMLSSEASNYGGGDSNGSNGNGGRRRLTFVFVSWCGRAVVIDYMRKGGRGRRRQATLFCHRH